MRNPSARTLFALCVMWSFLTVLSCRNKENRHKNQEQPTIKPVIQKRLFVAYYIFRYFNLCYSKKKGLFRRQLVKSRSE
jgi:hypothetical protein